MNVTRTTIARGGVAVDAIYGGSAGSMSEPVATDEILCISRGASRAFLLPLNQLRASAGLSPKLQSATLIPRVTRLFDSNEDTEHVGITSNFRRGRSAWPAFNWLAMLLIVCSFQI